MTKSQLNTDEAQRLAWYTMLQMYDYSDRWTFGVNVGFWIFMAVWCLMIVGALYGYH